MIQTVLWCSVYRPKLNTEEELWVSSYTLHLVTPLRISNVKINRWGTTIEKLTKNLKQIKIKETYSTMNINTNDIDIS